MTATAAARRSPREVATSSARGGGRAVPDRAAAYGILLLGLLYFLVPLVWLFLAATKSNADLFSTFGFGLGRSFELVTNLGALLERDRGAFVGWMRNTAAYAGAASIVSTVIAAMAGYGFAMYRFRARRPLFALVLGSVFVPATILAVPLYFMLGQLGLSNTLWAVILPALANPFGVYLVKIFAERAVPEELIDAARVDGAGEFRIFATIAVRLLAPGLVTVLLFAFVGAWNNYFLPLLVLRSSEVYTVTVGLAYWNALAAQPGQAQVLYAIVVTGSVVAILPVMALFLFLQRYWREGLSIGSIKG